MREIRFPEFERYDGLGLAQLVRERQVSAAELLEAALERVDGRNPALNAIVARLDDEARRAIAAGLPDGPFTGVPFLMKDISVHVKGAATTHGSRLFATAVADHDSEIVARYRRAGLVVFGKTNTPEFGLATTTEPRLFGPTKRSRPSSTRAATRPCRSRSTGRGTGCPSACSSSRRSATRRACCASPPSSSRPRRGLDTSSDRVIRSTAIGIHVPLDSIPVLMSHFRQPAKEDAS